MRIAPWPLRCLYRLFPPKVVGYYDSIELVNYGKTPILEEGDFIIAKMESLRYALLRVSKVYTPTDPGDQHFIWYVFYRYVKNVRVNRKPTPSSELS